MLKTFATAVAGTLAGLGLWTVGEKTYAWIRKDKDDKSKSESKSAA